MACPIAVGARTALKRIPWYSRTPTRRAARAGPRDRWRMVLEEVRASGSARRAIDQQLARVAREQPIARRLQQVPGVGVITATALMGAVGAHSRVSPRAAVCELAGTDAARIVQREAAAISGASVNAGTSISAAC